MKDYKSARKLGKAAYKRTQQSSYMDEESEEIRDSDGFIVLQSVAELPVTPDTDLVTDLSALEERMDRFILENEKDEPRYITYSDDETINEKSKKKQKKISKKQRKKLLKSIFNNADKVEETKAEEDESEPEVKKDTLTSTYGKRFSPMVSMIYDLINEYDEISEDIKRSLENSTNAKTMFKSSQTANLISAKNSKFSAIKELNAIATKLTDFEYKREKDLAANTDNEGITNKDIATLAASYIRGGINDLADDNNTAPTGKKKKKKHKEGKPAKSSMEERRSGYVSSEYITEEAEEIVEKSSNNEESLTKELSKALLKHKDEINFTPYEKHVAIEGKYTLAILADEDNPSSNWKFIALDKDGKEIKNFKDKYGELIPKKSDCHMSFDTAKLKVTDRNTSLTYKLLLK